MFWLQWPNINAKDNLRDISFFFHSCNESHWEQKHQPNKVIQVWVNDNLIKTNSVNYTFKVFFPLLFIYYILYEEMQ